MFKFHNNAVSWNVTKTFSFKQRSNSKLINNNLLRLRETNQFITEMKPIPCFALSANPLEPMPAINVETPLKPGREKDHR